MSADPTAVSGADSGPVNPFPQEEQAQQQPAATWNPWQGTPQPRWYAGMGVNEDTAYLGPLYHALDGAGQGAAKGEELLGGLWHTQAALGARYLGGVPGVGSYFREMEKDTATMQQDARERAKALTPDATTTGAAAELVHGLSSGLYRYTVGSLAGGPLAGAGLVGSTEATNRYQELTEQGVTPGAAGASAAVTGGFAAAGALMPAGFGTSLVGKILTGAGSNAGFGLVSRYADHKVLELAGYPEMAEQQKVWDTTAMMTDLVLGGGFGTIAHVMHAKGASPEEARTQIHDLEAKLGRGVPGAEDAALTANLAMRDRAAGPGVAVDPQAAQAHQAALEKGTADLLQGKSVDVSGTGIENATFAARPPEDRSNVQTLFVNALKDTGVLDEERNLRDLETALGARLRGEKPATAEEAPATARTTFTTAMGSTYEVTEAGTTIRNKAARTEHPGEFGPQPESERTFYVRPEDAERLGEFQAQGGPRSSVAMVDQNRAGVRYEEGGSAGKFERRTVVSTQDEPARGLIPVELWKNGQSVHFGNEITSVARGEPGAPRETAVLPESVTSDSMAAEGRYTVQEEPLTDEQFRVFQGLRSQLRTDQELGGSRGTEPEQSGAANAREPGAVAGTGKPLRVFRGAQRELSAGDFDAGVLGRSSGHPSSGLGVFFSLSKAEAGRYGSVTEHYLDIRNPKIFRAEDLPGFDSVEEAHAFREKLRAEGYDGLVIDGSHLGGPVNYVAFEPHQALPTAVAGRTAPAKVDPLADPAHQAVQENPQLEIPDEQGNLVNAHEALGNADQAVSDAERDSEKGILAAINCFKRKGGG